MGALFIVVAIYVLVAVAGVGAQPVERFEDPEQQSAGLSVILENITGSSVPATILAAGAVISIFSVTLVTLYGQTRILFAMGRDGMLPEQVRVGEPGVPHPDVQHHRGLDRGGPDRGLRAVGLPVGHGVHRHADGVHRGGHRRCSCSAVRRPTCERPFRVPGYPVTPLLTIAVCIYILSGLAAVTWVIFAVWLAIVLAFYLLWGRRNAALNKGVAADTDLGDGGR